jgi:choline dehydrogenase
VSGGIEMDNAALHPNQQGADYDFIIVGSGAGGGPLACNLAKNGFRVLVLEAGGWDAPEVAQIPAFHPQASEHPDLSWEFFVKHYAKPRERDSKKDEKTGDLFYPRAATVGGCTVHNAMITLCGPRGDWDEIARITDDESWSAERMRTYFERIEHCDYLTQSGSIWVRIWNKIGSLFGLARSGNPSRHGFAGWLHTTTIDPERSSQDKQLFKQILCALIATLRDQGLRAVDTIESFAADILAHKVMSRFDPNDWQSMERRPEGIMLVPIAVRKGERSSPRDYLVEVKKAYPERLTIQTETLVTEVLFDRDPGAAGEPQAIGVSFLRGKHLYKAHPQPSDGGGEAGQVFCRREVILCGGTFNTPQLLKLSGIGPKSELDGFGIPVRVDLPGVGTNLQDRYEIALVSETREDFTLLKNLSMRMPKPGEEPDPALQEWRRDRKGLYTNNAVLLGILKKSRRDLPAPDLFIFALPGFFKGYYKGYSEARADPDMAGRHNLLTWLVMKAHTRNRAGTVRLRSTDPRDPPEINFHYFYEGSDQSEEDDLSAITAGFKFARGINQLATNSGVIKGELWPGPEEVKDDESIRRFITREAWGHHASCSCPIGAKNDPMAVLDGRFRVRGTRKLRIVDASVFPRIPGVFIATNIYMISEKASDVITEDHRAGKSGQAPG